MLSEHFHVGLTLMGSEGLDDDDDRVELCFYRMGKGKKKPEKFAHYMKPNKHTFGLGRTTHEKSSRANKKDREIFLAKMCVSLMICVTCPRRKEAKLMLRRLISLSPVRDLCGINLRQSGRT